MWPFTGKKKKKKTVAPVITDETSIVSKLQRLLRMNIHAAIDEAENPEMLMDDLIRQFSAVHKETRTQVTSIISDLRMLESEQHEEQTKRDENQVRAEAAAARAKTQIARGQIEQAEKTKELARVALQRKQAQNKRIEARATTIEKLNLQVEDFKKGLDVMQEKLNELTSRRNDISSRLRVAAAQNSAMDAAEMISGTDATSALNSIENRTKRAEADAAARYELTQSSLDSRMEQLQRSESYQDADYELEAMMNEEITSDAAGSHDALSQKTARKQAQHLEQDR